jgi:hypothetical protein
MRQPLTLVLDPGAVALFLNKKNSSFSLQAVTPGATIFVGQYLFTGSETTSVWLEVKKEFALRNVFCLFHILFHRICLFIFLVPKLSSA